MTAMKAIHCLPLVVLLIGAPFAVQSAEIEGVFFKDTYKLPDRLLTVRGTGLYRHLGFIKAYVGALYVAEGRATQAVLSDVAKRLEVEYFHAIEGEDFGAATNKVIGRNIDSETLEKLRPRIEKHNAMYKDVQPGDRYALTYIPGKGTELALNGEPIGLIEGADFAAALFGMWLGAQPMNKAFKRQLMRAE